MQHLGIDLLQPSPALRGRYPKPDGKTVALARAKGIDVLPPVAVRRHEQGHEILLGISTWLVAQQLQVSDVPVVVLDGVGDEEAATLALQDVSGDDPNPIALARQLQSVLSSDERPSKAEVGRRFGLSRTEVSHLVRLLDLAPAVQQLLIEGKIRQGHAQPLIGLPPARQAVIARQAAEQGLSVARVRALAKAGGSEGEGSNTRASPLVAEEAADPCMQALERDLSALVGSPVRIRRNPETGAGTLEVDFFNTENLEGIIERWGYRFPEEDY
jgi:ParB family chromosome partitioning protein